MVVQVLKVSVLEALRTFRAEDAEELAIICKKKSVPAAVLARVQEFAVTLGRTPVKDLFARSKTLYSIC